MSIKPVEISVGLYSIYQDNYCSWIIKYVEGIISLHVQHFVPMAPNANKLSKF